MKKNLQHISDSDTEAKTTVTHSITVIGGKSGRTKGYVYNVSCQLIGTKRYKSRTKMKPKNTNGNTIPLRTADQGIF